jgi:periplasmic divalent cation tolerance protein
MSACFIYVTASGSEEARRIGRALVEARLAACANVIDRVTSVYWWRGEVQEDDEAVLIAKTREDLVDDLTAKVKELHSYECPCVVALPVTGGNADFLDWIESETRR